MATFAETINPTPFGFFDSDIEFQQEADKMVNFVKRSLGDDVLSVELTKKQIWLCFEESLLKYGQVVNEFQAISNLSNYLGYPTGSLSSGSLQNKYPRNTFEMLMRQAEPYAAYAGVGGSAEMISGSIQLQAGRQDYDLYTELSTSSGVGIYGNQAASKKTKLRVHEIFHFSPSAAYRFFSSTSAINYLNNEFSFESFTPETIFYVLPVFEDILRAGMMDVSQRVRRSNYSYKIVGTKLRIFPTPTSVTTTPKKLWINLFYALDPLDPAYDDATIDGVSNLSNIPFGNIQFSNLNSIGRNWVREYCLALCMILLGLVRSKFSTVPIPNADLTLNGDKLIEMGSSSRDKMLEDLKELLGNLTYEKLLETEAKKSESLINTLKNIPIPFGGIITG